MRRFVSVADLWVTALERHGDRPAVAAAGTALGRRAVAAEVSRYARALASFGLGQGSPVGTLSLNRPEAVFAWGANLITGARITPLTATASVDDLAYILEDAGIDTLIFEPTDDERAAEVEARAPGVRRLLALGPSEVGVDLTAAAAAQPATRLWAPEVAPDGVDRIMYTGGTTGRPKGIVGTFGSSAAVASIQSASWQWPDDTRFLICSPMSHAGGAFVLPTLLRGGQVVTLPRFDPDQVLDTIERYRITATMLVPTMLYALLDHPRLEEADLSSLETVFYGAAAMSPARLQEAVERLGPIFFQFYGQSEAPMTITALRKEDHTPDRLASCGRAVPWMHVALLDDDCQPVAAGEPGEICVMGPTVMREYWRKPELTAEVFAGGWLHTGDVARMTDDGFLTIIDRKKDVIISGGFNVYAREVESAIAEHPAVATAAVFGVPDEKWGEAVRAVVVVRDGAEVTDQELKDLVRARKGPIVSPKAIEFRSQVPLTPLGKPDKAALRREYWQEHERNVH
ncbi:MAG TPA: AMP-binding protein [Acidimicrobiales bacterium]|nr:AMP-binding protein [Acidimicrobiales bacterium]